MTQIISLKLSVNLSNWKIIYIMTQIISLKLSV